MIKISQTSYPAIGVLYSGGGRENFRRNKPRGRETAGNSQGKDDIKFTSSLAAMCIVLAALKSDCRLQSLFSECENLLFVFSKKASLSSFVLSY
jgi:hypothetical protein